MEVVDVTSGEKMRLQVDSRIGNENDMEINNFYKKNDIWVKKETTALESAFNHGIQISVKASEKENVKRSKQQCVVIYMNINVLIYRIKKAIGLNGVLKNIYSDYKIRDSIMSSLIEFNRHSGFAIGYTLRELMQYTDRSQNDQHYAVGQYKDIVVAVPPDLMKDIEDAGCRIKSCRMYEMQNVILTLNNRVKRGIKDLAWNFSKQEMYTWNESDMQIMFRAPNSIVLENCSYIIDLLYDKEIQIICEHPKNLSTISINLESRFEELCKLDLMIDMFNNNLAFLKLDIGNGAIDPPLQDFQNAADLKKQLLEDLRIRGSIDNIQM